MEEFLPVILPLVWAVILAFAVFLYVILDGFDLGLGALFPFAPSHEDRDAMMRSVAPFWDGNETWLVLGGAGLLGAFPLAYSIMLPALYIPIIVMLIGLILRGVAFEFRFKAKTSRWLWDVAFAGGSIAAAFMQGVIIGAFIYGFKVSDGAYWGGPLDWLTPFSLLTGISVVAGYVLLASCWLIMTAKEELAAWGYRIVGYAFPAVGLCVLIVSIWTPLLHPRIAERWFTPANMVMLCPVPLVSALVAYALYRSLSERRRYAPFLLAIALFMLCYTGLAVSLFPYIVPPDITIWKAAAAPASQLFLLYGTVPILPVIVGYTVYSYYSLWGHHHHPAADAYH